MRSGKDPERIGRGKRFKPSMTRRSWTSCSMEYDSFFYLPSFCEFWIGSILLLCFCVATTTEQTGAGSSPQACAHMEGGAAMYVAVDQDRRMFGGLFLLPSVLALQHWGSASQASLRRCSPGSCKEGKNCCCSLLNFWSVCCCCLMIVIIYPSQLHSWIMSSHSWTWKNSSRRRQGSRAVILEEEEECWTKVCDNPKL